jgi:hypothetical protein
MLWFFKYFRRKIQQKIGVFDSNQSWIMQNFDRNIGFEKKRQFFRRKLSKIAENRDHNIDPRSLAVNLLWNSWIQLSQQNRSAMNESLSINVFWLWGIAFRYMSHTESVHGHSDLLTHCNCQDAILKPDTVTLQAVVRLS